MTRRPDADRMPLYFFDIDEGTGLSCGTEPVEFPNDGSARADAARTLAEMARDRADGAHSFLAVHVRRKTGEVIGVATLVMDVRPQDRTPAAPSPTTGV